MPDAGVVVGESLRLAVAAFAYTGPMRSALAALKYGSARRLAPILAEAARSALPRLLGVTGEAVVLVPVPVHRERLAQRGYNQAELLAWELGRWAKLPVEPLLDRTRPTTNQHRLNRVARLRNLRGAFTCRLASTPRTVILVDDIITTTATLEACASVLLRAGTESVYGFAIAREV